MPNDIFTTNKGGGGYDNGEQAELVVLIFGEAWQEAFYDYFKPSVVMFRLSQDIMSGDDVADATNDVLRRCSKIIAFLSVDSFEAIIDLMAGEFGCKLAIIRVSFVDAEILTAFDAKNIPYLPQAGQPLSKYKSENDAMYSIEKHVKRLLGIAYKEPLKKAPIKDDLPIWIIQKLP